MCGRFNLRVTPEQLQQFFDLLQPMEVSPRFNIAPTQTTVVCRQNQTGHRELVPLQWGLIPSWAKEARLGASLINARGETVAEKPSFRSAFRKRRCLIPMSGFYEWRREGKMKRPFHIHHADDSLFAVAGLWEAWDKADQPIESFSIITTSANSTMAPIHNRMPVVLEPELFDAWLDPRSEPEFLTALLQPSEWTGFETVEVSPVVNNARHESPDCLQTV
jgi:putative SOS response-associated peptidase YedK